MRKSHAWIKIYGLPEPGGFPILLAGTALACPGSSTLIQYVQV
jgi:hypothetical protein